MDIREFIEKNEEKLLEDIFTIVRIPSIKEEPQKEYPFGKNVGYALEKTLEIAEKMGFNTKNIDNYVGYAQIGEGEEYIGVLGHLDIVPEGKIEDWKITNPYNPKIYDNKIYGRGVLDNKGPIISTLYALKYLRDEKKLKKRVRIIFGTNEESGDEDIKYYLDKEKAPKYAFTPDGRFPVIYSERGILQLSLKKNIKIENCKEISGKSPMNMLPASTIIELNCDELQEKSKVLSILEESNYEYFFKENNRRIKIEFVGKNAPTIKMQNGKNSNKDAIDFLVKYYNIQEFKDIKRYCFDEKIIKNTDDDFILSCNTLEYEGDMINIKLDIRYPYPLEKNKILERIKEVFQGYEIEIVSDSNPLYFPKNSKLIKTLIEVYKKITKRDEEPAKISGGTYARLMPNTVAFGPNFREFNGNPHSSDENIDIDMLKIGIEIYAMAILELSKYLEE